MSWTGVVFLLTYFVITTTVKCDEVCGTDGRTYQQAQEFNIAQYQNPNLQLLYLGPCLKVARSWRQNDWGYDNSHPFYRPFKDMTFSYDSRRSVGRSAKSGGRRYLIEPEYPSYPPQYGPYYPQYPGYGYGNPDVPGYQGGFKGGLSGNLGLNANVGGQMEAGVSRGPSWGK